MSQVKLDARQQKIKSDVQASFNKIRVDRLISPSLSIAKGAGFVGVSMRLDGAGNSIAEAAKATSDGDFGW